MIFNSNIFLYTFLPCLLIAYYFVYFVLKRNIKLLNFILIIFSVVFYACSSIKGTFLLFAVSLFNYFGGILINKFKDRNKQILFVVFVAGNIATLLYFKYACFFVENYNIILQTISPQSAKIIINVILPVGISFYIFQALSYIVDVYRNQVKVSKNYFDFLLYIVLFPQLVAGPIVRYKTIEKEIAARELNTNDIYQGFCRFTIGLAKKALIADILGTAVDAIWELPEANLSILLAWSAAFLYTLQIYYDFSGYSDMAIGIGRMLGFHFPENFDVPYSSSNMTEFWKRWHISLSGFLRDYVYIPLGGNRMGKLKTYRNLFIVFLLCGMWHGAAWNFILWGIYHGIFLIAERILREKFSFTMHGWIGRVITFFIVMVGWVLFRADSISDAFSFLRVMFGGENLQGFQYFTYQYYVYLKIIVIGIFSFIVSFFSWKKMRECLYWEKAKGIICLLLLVVSMAYLSDASFNAFIYFQF